MKTITRYILASSIFAILIITAFAFYSIKRFHEAELREENENLERCIRTFRELFRNKGKEFRIVDGRLQVDDYVVNGNFEVPDKVQTIFGGVATVFMGDTRVSTNLLDAGGNRAVGTRLVGPAYDAVFSQGKAYRGELLIFNTPYLTACDPISDSKGRIIGALFVGVKKSEFLKQFNLLKMQTISSLCGLLLFFVILMFLLGRTAKKLDDMKEEHLFFLQTLIDTIPNPVFYKDAAGKFLGANRAMESCVGIPRDELIGNCAHDLWPKEQADLYLQKDQELFEKPGAQGYFSSVRYDDGTMHDVVINKATFQGKDGVIGGLVGVMLDITTLKAATEEIRNAYQHLFDIIEFLPDATFVLDEEQRVVAWNLAIEKMTGVGKEEILGKGDFEYAIPFYGIRRPMLINLIDRHKDDFKHCYDSIERIGRTLSVEVRIPSFRNGADRYFWSTASSLFNKNGKKIGAIQTIRDITERRRSEEDKTRLAAQLQLSRMLGSVMIQLGHDLKTPLTPLLALLPLLRDRSSDPESARMADICCINARHLGGLSDKMLRLAQLSSVANTANMEKVALASSVDEYIRDYRPMAVEKNIACENLIDPKVFVKAAPEQLRELFANLISNAIRFSAPNGIIHIYAEQGEKIVTVAVKDKGAGIAPEHLESIFSEFFKTDESRHDLAFSGLGLSICKRIVLNHQGRIWAESAGKDLGTTILFTLPLFEV